MWVSSLQPLLPDPVRPLYQGEDDGLMNRCWLVCSQPCQPRHTVHKLTETCKLHVGCMHRQRAETRRTCPPPLQMHVPRRGFRQASCGVGFRSATHRIPSYQSVHHMPSWDRSPLAPPRPISPWPWPPVMPHSSAFHSHLFTPTAHSHRPTS